MSWCSVAEAHAARCSSNDWSSCWPHATCTSWNTSQRCLGSNGTVNVTAFWRELTISAFLPSFSWLVANKEIWPVKSCYSCPGRFPKDISGESCLVLAKQKLWDNDTIFSNGCANRLDLVLLGRLPKVDLIILEGKNVRPSVRPSVHKKFLRFQWNLVYR